MESVPEGRTKTDAEPKEEKFFDSVSNQGEASQPTTGNTRVQEFNRLKALSPNEILEIFKQEMIGLETEAIGRHEAADRKLASLRQALTETNQWKECRAEIDAEADEVRAKAKGMAKVFRKTAEQTAKVLMNVDNVLLDMVDLILLMRVMRKKISVYWFGSNKDLESLEREFDNFQIQEGASTQPQEGASTQPQEGASTQPQEGAS